MSYERYVQANNKGDKTRAHRVIAEKVLGRPLPDGVEVHHIDNDGRNNSHNNLVICQSKAYHLLLHRRQRALDESGHAHWRKCIICKKWDDPEKIKIYKIGNGERDRAAHNSCNNIYAKALRMSKK